MFCIFTRDTGRFLTLSVLEVHSDMILHRKIRRNHRNKEHNRWSVMRERHAHFRVGLALARARFITHSLGPRYCRW
jgi:hypothetical protein